MEKNTVQVNEAVVGKRARAAMRAKRLGVILNRRAMLIAAIMICFIAMSGTALAAGSTPAVPNVDTLWSTISGLVQTWATRLGGVVMFIGGIMFGMGWRSDDAEQRSRGVNTIIAGAIVIGVAALTGIFFAT